MTCKKCAQASNKMQLDISQIQNISEEQTVALYKQGYRLSESNIQSAAIEDVSAWQYMWLGLFSYGTYKMHESKHDIIAIILGALALSTAGGIYGSIKK